MESIRVDKEYSRTPKPSSHKQDSAIISLKNIHKTYLLGIEGVPALRGVSVEVYQGEFVIIYGTSGGGKTSLLNIIGTIDKPTKGEMTLCGVTINPRTRDEELSNIRLRNLYQVNNINMKPGINQLSGFVFQTFNLLGSMTALENVELPMTLKAAVGPEERRKLAIASLTKVGLSHRADHFPSQLSGGEQQRVAIARAIANEPSLLCADEPTGDLDTKNSERIVNLMNRLNEEEGMSIVMVTHDMSLKNFAHRVIWMRDGKVAKIEKIAPERRRQAVEELRTKVQEVAVTHSANNALPASWSNTEVRSPDEYLPYSFARKHQVEENPRS